MDVKLMMMIVSNQCKQEIFNKIRELLLFYFEYGGGHRRALAIRLPCRF